MKAETIYQAVGQNWFITKKDLQDLGINPDKKWERIMLFELSAIASFLYVTISDLTDS
ncbi:hypothetical protein [Flavobacterium sp.]|uniref:hypothetical protein n=1 Tax=Flavobacterium sp. TaxID=239 RepID=UPI0040345A09